MFNKDVYIRRRNSLKNKVGNGIIVLAGNDEVPMNYKSNTYPFRQDSHFLYFFGIDSPKLLGVIDLDSNREFVVGDDPDLDDIIWMGSQKSLIEKASGAGINQIVSLKEFITYIQNRISRHERIHILPPYSAERVMFLGELFSCTPLEVEQYISKNLIQAIAGLRSVKEEVEIREIESTLNEVTSEMHLTMIRMANEGVMEYEISGAVEGLARKNDRLIPYPVICSVNGEVLHNHNHNNKLQPGQLLLLDAGCESPLHYATDITRTVPVGRTFSPQQKAVYEIVLKMQKEGIQQIKPGIPYLDVHLYTCQILAEELIALGLMKGNAADAVREGAHAMFMPHGLGHMIGLDVHDMEDLGEDNFAYNEEVKRSEIFGTANLRLGKRLEEGYVITVEPGIYFIPELYRQWKQKNKHAGFINYPEVEKYLGFGGIRIEDNVLVTSENHRILGNPIPKEINAIEKIA